MASQLYNYTPVELQKIFDESCSYAEVFGKLNMSQHGGNYSTLRKIIDEYKLDLTQINKNREEQKNITIIGGKRSSLPLEKILIKNIQYKGSTLKERLIKEGLKEYRCECCGLSEWNGKPIPLQLHHDDGDHYNNEIKNLKLLCPNCHAQTDTFAGKNIDHSKQNKQFKNIEKDVKIAKRGISEDGQRLYDGYGNYKILCPKCKINFMNKAAYMCSECYKREHLNPKISKEELFAIMKDNSYYSAADLLGVDRKTVSRWHKYYVNEDKKNNIQVITSDKAPTRDVLKQKIRTMPFVQIGKEYNVTDNSVRKWCDTYKLPRLKSEINSYSDEEWKTI